jgi:acetoin utilization protein AcuB
MSPHIPTIRKYMSPAPQTIGREATITQAMELMDELGIRHLPVLEKGKIIGLISDRDVRLIESLEGIDRQKILVDDVMTRDPYFTEPNTPLEEVVSFMADKKFGSALVVEGGKVIGIFTMIDALRVLSELLPSPRKEI